MRRRSGGSVVTLASGRQAHLEALILGLEQAHRPPAELVVVRMNGWRPKNLRPPQAFDLRFVDASRPDGKLPLAAARNAGARAARSEALIFLDVDCVPSPPLPAAYGDGLALSEGIFMGEVRYLPPGAGERFRAGGDFSELEGAGTVHAGREPPREGVRRAPRYEAFWSLSFAVRRSVFLSTIGGFDEGYAGYGAEDTDFAFRARRAGVPLSWVGGSAAFHQHHATHDPPLQHLEDIVANARLFRSLWGRWPMEGWLSAFRQMGLVEWENDRLSLLRRPTPGEIFARRRGSPTG